MTRKNNPLRISLAWFESHEVQVPKKTTTFKLFCLAEFCGADSD